MVIGDRGAKKHVYADRLSKLLEVPHISMGTLVRQELNPRSSLYKQVQFRKNLFFLSFASISVENFVSVILNFVSLHVVSSYTEPIKESFDLYRANSIFEKENISITI